MVFREGLVEEVILKLRTQQCKEPRESIATRYNRKYEGLSQERHESEERKPVSGPGAKPVRRKVCDAHLICHDGQRGTVKSF